MSTKATIRKEKNINNSNNKQKNTPSISDSSSIFEDINFSAIFNPNNKFINSGKKTSYDLMKYDLDIFNSLSSIYKNLNVSEEQIYKDSNYSLKLIETVKKNDENNNENINNSSNNNENIFTDSILKFLLSESESENKTSNKKKNKNKKLNDSEFVLNKEDLDELLKDYSPMEIEKESNK